MLLPVTRIGYHLKKSENTFNRNNNHPDLLTILIEEYWNDAVFEINLFPEKLSQFNHVCSSRKKINSFFLH